jgi:hypothetical protein
MMRNGLGFSDSNEEKLLVPYTFQISDLVYLGKKLGQCVAN